MTTGIYQAMIRRIAVPPTNIHSSSRRSLAGGATSVRTTLLAYTVHTEAIRTVRVAISNTTRQ